MAILLFVFFLIVFILMLVGGRILKKIKDTKKAVEEAADRKEQRYRNETGRQRQQYSQRPQSAERVRPSQNTEDAQNAADAQSAERVRLSQSEAPSQPEEQENARRTQTATGETIIDHHHEARENKKIFDDSDGEYVEFTEEP